MSGPANKTASPVRQLVDFGALLAFMAAYAVNRFARGLDGQEALVQATWVLVGASALALLVGWIAERRLAPLPLLAGGFAGTGDGHVVLDPCLAYDTPED